MCFLWSEGFGGEGAGGLGVVALVFAVEVVGPVLVEVAVGVQGAEFEDGFGGLDAPVGSAENHAVLDKLPGRAPDEAAGHGPADCQEGGVVQVVLLDVQVAGAFVSVGALGGAVSLAVVSFAGCNWSQRRLRAVLALLPQAATLHAGQLRVASSERQVRCHGHLYL